MKNVLKRIIVGIIIGLVLMCCRKYLFINASAATRVSPIMDNYRFTYNNDTFKQSAFNGQNADLPDSTLGATNSGSLQYYFHTNGNVEVKKGNILYFTIGTSISNSSTTYVNSTFSMGNVGYITTGLDSHYFPCEVSTIIADNDTSFYYTARDYYGAGQGRSFYTDAILILLFGLASKVVSSSKVHL